MSPDGGWGGSGARTMSGGAELRRLAFKDAMASGGWRPSLLAARLATEVT